MRFRAPEVFCPKRRMKICILAQSVIQFNRSAGHRKNLFHSFQYRPKRGFHPHSKTVGNGLSQLPSGCWDLKLGNLQV